MYANRRSGGMRGRGPRGWAVASGCAGLLGLAWLCGCHAIALLRPDARVSASGASDAQPAPRPRLSPVLERMRRAYPDLASNRFISLADFETPEQIALFHTVTPDGSDDDRHAPTMSILRSRNETGAGGLKAVLPTPGHTLVLDGRRSERLALVRDWRPYGLLLMSVYGPPGGAALRFAVRSGETLPIEWSRTLTVAPGWNLLRLDVATIGDVVDLSDVRSLSWSAPDAGRAVEFYLDDLILADNTRWVLGEHAGLDELHVFTRGQRIHVGVPSRFALEFADGVIVAWHEASPGAPLATARGSEQNLADTGGLGPWPVPLPDNWWDVPAVAYDDPRHFESWGAAVATTQRLVEAGPLRAVIEGEWRFVQSPPAATPGASPAATAPAERPGHTWRYVILPAGRVHVRLTSVAPPAGWGAPRVGFAVGLDGHRGFRAASPAAADPAYALMARPGPARADLLWTWPRDTHLERQRELASEDERRVALLLGDIPAGPVVETAHLLRIWPPDIDAAPEAAALASDYREPAALEVSSGRTVTDAPGDADGDGYNEAEGCYELAPDGGVLRLTFTPGAGPRFEPLFRVRETAGRECWVYARGRMLTEVGRDADNNLLFALSRVSGRPVAIEVNTRGAPQ